MTELRKQYISYMRYRNYSARTITSYCACLIQLSNLLNQLISAYKILITEVTVLPLICWKKASTWLLFKNCSA